MRSILVYLRKGVILRRFSGYARTKVKVFSGQAFVALYVAVFLSAALPSAVLSQDNQVQRTIQNEVQQLERAGNFRIRDEDVVSAKILPAFYKKREFAPAWTNQAAREELLAAIRGIEEDGLQPAGYHLDRIESLLAGSQPEAALQNIADLDLLMTDAALTLGYHLLFGKLDPQCLFKDWDVRLADTDINLTEEVQKAIDSVKVAELFESFRAKHIQYTRLKRALANYRAIAAKGGWDPVPSGPALKPGDRSPRLPALRKRLAITGELPTQSTSDESQTYDKQAVVAVQRFQRLHLIKPDGVVEAKTLEAMNTTVEQRIEQILVNLERARWIIKPDADTKVTVNIAGFKLYYSGPNNTDWETRVVVGRPYRKTPVFKSRIDRLVFNPAWIVPPTILKEDILPKVKRNHRYLRKHKFRVIRKSPYTLEQVPGPKNPLGRVKFTFPNPYEVYLHDTPDKKLFDRTDRTVSSGCIRVEGALHLAELLLDPQGVSHEMITRMLHSRKTDTIAMKQPVPILVLYWTVEILPGEELMFIPDVYGQDTDVLDGLQGRLPPCNY